MFAQTYQSGFLSLLYSVGSKPLQLWDKHAAHARCDGAIRRVLDDDIQSAVIEISCESDAASADALIHTYVRCPAPTVADSLHIRLPQLIFQLKPMPNRELSIEVDVCDHLHQRRRFRLSTYQRATVVHDLLTHMPLRLDAGVWNQLQLDLPTLTMEAYGSRYAHTANIQIHAHCRVRRVFFADQMHAEQVLPLEFRLLKRLTKQQTAQFKAEDAETAA